MIEISVIICTRNPDCGRLHRTLRGLIAQTLPADHWELLLVDNGSHPALTVDRLGAIHPNLRILTESTPGLTPARLCGIRQALGEVLVFVDDDNVLCADYLAFARQQFATSSRLSAAGGPICPEFETSPPSWIEEFNGLLALRDFGPSPQFAKGDPNAAWPDFAPVGAGLCIRKAAAENYARVVEQDPARAALDRRAGQLTSGGDNDMVFTTLQAGGDVAYFPELSLIHLIPESRLQIDYLARLNRAIQRSWIRVLSLHGASSWDAIPRWSVPLRMFKAWCIHRPWKSPSRRIRWQGACGHFEGRADLS